MLPEQLSKETIKYCLNAALNELIILRTPSLTMEQINLCSEIIKDRANLTDAQKDYNFVEFKLNEIYGEIDSKGSYEELLKLLENFKKTHINNWKVIQENKRLGKKLLELQRLSRNEECAFQDDIDNYMRKIGKMKDSIRDFQTEFEIKNVYLQSWEAARLELTQHSLGNRENEKKQTIIDKQHDFTKEERVHQEISNIYNESEKDLQEETTKWTTKYETDVANLQHKINEMHNKRSQQNEKIATLAVLLQKRQNQMDEFKTYKLQRDEKIKENQKRERAATKIQAWWRGTMVRRGLGKYRKKKDKKSKKKGSGKKK